jgi:hypothetical protein
MIPTLVNAAISFHTNDEDKDDDTHVTVRVTDENNVIAAEIDNDFGHFDDNSDSGPYDCTQPKYSKSASKRLMDHSY